MNIYDLLDERSRTKTDINEHLLFLRGFVDENQVLDIVEFGVRDGNSTCAFLASSARSLVSVDLAWHPDLDRVDDAYRNTEPPKPAWKFIPSDDLDIPQVKCDLLFIDSNHTSRHLRQELALHAGGVSRYLALHDTETFWDRDQFRNEEGMGRAIKEFFGNHPEWVKAIHMSNNNGLTIWERRK